jgi:hypothetical protein
MSRGKTITHWRPSLAFWTALVFVAVAVVAVVLYEHHKLRAWMPNVATSAASIAITVTVINGIVRSEARKRIRPRVAAALQFISRTVETFSGLVALDYGSCHVSTFEPIPKTASEMLDLWATGWDTNDWAHEYLDSIIAQGHALADNLKQTRALNFDVLEPGLVQAIDTFCHRLWQIGNIQKIRLADKDEDRREKWKQKIARDIVRETHRLSLVLLRYAPAIPIDETYRSINEIREQE